MQLNLFSLNTIGRRIFFSFGILILNLVVLVTLACTLLWNTHTTTQIWHAVDRYQILTTQLVLNDLNFLHHETARTQFFMTGKSAVLDKRDSIKTALLMLEAGFAESSVIVEDTQGKLLLNSLAKRRVKYESTFCSLFEVVKRKGFKDFGAEGAMRDYAHALERNAPLMPLAETLALRRHEKDFLLRKEQVYVDLFNIKADQLLVFLKEDLASTQLLQDYRKAFNEVARLTNLVGLEPNEGLRGELTNDAADVVSSIDRLSSFVDQQRSTNLIRSIVIFSISSLCLIVFSIVFTTVTSRKLASPIKKLSESMTRFMVTEGFDEHALGHQENTNEVSALSQTFAKLCRKLRKQFSEIVRQNKELKKLNEELDRFIYSTAHDLRSPIASLTGLIHLAKQESDVHHLKQYFEMMNTSVTRLQGFINDIGDFAKNKRQHLKVEKLEVDAFFSDMVAEFQSSLNNASINLAVQTAGGPMYTDRVRLEIILRNLMSNTIAFRDTKKKNRFVELTAKVVDDQISIVIFDNGIGIGRQHMPKIFDMFYRGTEHSKGAGIGLYLVRESVKILRGKIYVDSVLDEWTMFNVTLPSLRHINLDIPETDDVVASIKA